ncbi:MAG: asparagine synthase (glutamine-hydrolyzing) [Victivallaceae bacterium]
MCGIAGIINFTDKTAATAVLERMNSAQAHRGPDDSGIFADSRAALGHRRLSIIDLSNGHQPLGNEDGSVQIVFNGEIYNHDELRQRLETRGHVFRTHCDTEAIVHLYEEHGADCVKLLKGMFAFCIYDHKLGRVLLARDRMGQKPLFYFRHKRLLAFASELGALKQHPDMPRELNLQSLHDYFSMQYIPAPLTVYKDVYKLPPAHFLDMDIDDGSFRIERYWQPDYSVKTNLSFHDAAAQLRELLTLAVKRRLMSDVPFGAFLSGGLDSSIVTGIMSQLCDNPVKTFTIGFAEKQYDERSYATIAAAAINRQAAFPLQYHEQVVNSQDFDLLRKLAGHYGEPYSDASMLPTFLLSKFTREHVTVAISGDGADELFAGYERYLVMKYSAYSDKLPLPLRKLLFGIPSKFMPDSGERTMSGRLRRTLRTVASESSQRYLDIICRFDEKQKKQLYGERFDGFKPISSCEIISSAYNNATAVNHVEKIMETDVHTYLPGDILTKVDIASMACSLEVRSPFMDHELVEFAASLPLDFKLRGTSRKHILKEAFKDLIPPEISERRKKGFGVPLAAWFRGPWKNMLSQHLLEGELTSGHFFKPNVIKELLEQHFSARADNSYVLWSMLLLELFLEQEKNGIQNQ